MYEKVSREIMIKKHFGCRIEDIAKTVIVTPVWNRESFKCHAEEILCETEGWYDCTTLKYKGIPITIIETSVGAPMVGDCVLALQYSDCENIFFTGSAGAVNPALDFGDLLAVHEAVIGEGFSRYHRGDIRKDCFGELSEGNWELAEGLLEVVKDYEKKLGVNTGKGRIFSIDSILGENRGSFEYMLEKGCDMVEMEVSAVFTASRCAGKKTAAFIIISDLPLKERSLFEGITQADKEKFRRAKEAMPEILLEAAARLRR